MTEKKMTVNFAPGCFDHFDGSQEELDELMVHLQEMFNTLTPEELEAMSVPLNETDLTQEEWDILDASMIDAATRKLH